MNIKQLNEKLAKFIEAETIEFAVIDNTIYYGNIPEGWDKKEITLDGNLIYIQANDEDLFITNTQFKTLDDFINECKKEYAFLKDQKIDVQGSAFADEFLGGIDTTTDDEILETEEAFIQHCKDWYNDSRIDGDSEYVKIFVDNNLDTVLGGDSVYPI